MIDKYRKTTIYLLLGIAVIIGVLLVDRLVLPAKIIEDKIVRYRVLTSTRSTPYGTAEVYIGDRYYTELGYEFTLDIDRPILDPKITLTQSMLFKNLNTVENKKHDYSDRLSSGFNGICLLFTHIIAFSTVISLILLIRNQNLSKNQFQNILLFNGFMIFITLYLWAIYN